MTHATGTINNSVMSSSEPSDAKTACNFGAGSGGNQITLTSFWYAYRKCFAKYGLVLLQLKTPV